jgi:histone H3/H4
VINKKKEGSRMWTAAKIRKGRFVNIGDWTSTKIGRFVSLLPEGKIFTTRDCVQYGKRATVDQTLCRFVRRGRIRRLARGVFVKDRDCRFHYSNYEIAKAKAESFGRRIFEDASNIARERGFKGGKKDKTVFAIDGRSSSFKIGDTVIHLKEVQPRKRALHGSNSGEAALTLWEFGKDSMSDYAHIYATLGFSRPEMLDFRTKTIQWMPAWISDYISIRPWLPPDPVKWAIA